MRAQPGHNRSFPTPDRMLFGLQPARRFAERIAATELPALVALRIVEVAALGLDYG